MWEGAWPARGGLKGGAVEGVGARGWGLPTVFVAGGGGGQEDLEQEEGEGDVTREAGFKEWYRTV